jgi:hypothetical protein
MCASVDAHVQLRQDSPNVINEPSTMLNRADLCRALLDGFSDGSMVQSQQLDLRFRTECVSIDTNVMYTQLCMYVVLSIDKTF